MYRPGCTCSSTKPSTWMMPCTSMRAELQASIAAHSCIIRVSCWTAMAQNVCRRGLCAIVLLTLQSILLRLDKASEFMAGMLGIGRQPRLSRF